MNTLFSEIIFDASFTFIIIGTFIALFFGLGLIFFPITALKFNDKINTRFSMRKATKKIETAIQSEPFFYKHSKLSGAILVLGSAFVLYTLTTFDAFRLIPHLPKSISPLAWEWIIESAQIFFYASGVFTIIFGFIVFTRPSLVKGFEKAANHWISTRKGFSKMSLDINITNNLVSTYPRVFGLFIVITSIIVLSLLWSDFKI